jgi:Acyl-CoA dehydrogenase, C-terminal domain/Acetyl-CoA dehydrogenase C-terminal like
MFVMMNAARLQVGVQGVAIAERAFQQALDFARERKQGRTVWEADGAIHGHPDVRRMLILMKAKIEAARAICLMTGVLSDIARLAESEDERATAKARAELLTPIAKAWSTDIGVEVASLGVQVHGGMGFIEETGAAQHYRDARIGPIYEGTNGIQAVDLVGRKVFLADGLAMQSLCAELALTAEKLSDVPELAAIGGRLFAGVAALERATSWILVNRGPHSLAAATPYLKLAGDVIGGAMLGRQALAAYGADKQWLKVKLALARVFAGQILTLAPGLAESVCQGAEGFENVDPAALWGW